MNSGRSAGRSSSREPAGRGAVDSGSLPAGDLDVDGWTSVELVAVRREIRKTLDGLPEYATKARKDHEADIAAIDSALGDRILALEGLLLWNGRTEESPLAAGVLGELAMVKNDEQAWQVVRALTDRLVPVERVPEPIEESELVADVDLNSPFSFRQPAKKPDMWARAQTATHDDPLNQRAASAPRKQLTTRADGEAYRRNAAETRTAEQAFADLSGDSGRPGRMIGTATHEQYEEAHARRRVEAEARRSTR